MDRESYELMENAVVPSYVIPGFHTADCFLSFKVYTPKSYRSLPNEVKNYVSNLDTSKLYL